MSNMEKPYDESKRNSGNSSDEACCVFLTSSLQDNTFEHNTGDEVDKDTLPADESTILSDTQIHDNAVPPKCCSKWGTGQKEKMEVLKNEQYATSSDFDDISDYEALVDKRQNEIVDANSCGQCEKVTDIHDEIIHSNDMGDDCSDYFALLQRRNSQETSRNATKDFKQSDVSSPRSFDDTSDFFALNRTHSDNGYANTNLEDRKTTCDESEGFDIPNGQSSVSEPPHNTNTVFGSGTDNQQKLNSLDDCSDYFALLKSSSSHTKDEESEEAGLLHLAIRDTPVEHSISADVIPDNQSINEDLIIEDKSALDDYSDYIAMIENRQNQRRESEEKRTNESQSFSLIKESKTLNATSTCNDEVSVTGGNASISEYHPHNVECDDIVDTKRHRSYSSNTAVWDNCKTNVSDENETISLPNFSSFSEFSRCVVAFRKHYVSRKRCQSLNDSESHCRHQMFIESV